MIQNLINWILIIFIKIKNIYIFRRYSKKINFFIPFEKYEEHFQSINQ
jgi:hypothetical protein